MRLRILIVALAASAAEATTLRMAIPGRPPGLGNPYASMATGGVHPWGMMFDALTYLGDGGRVEPWIATSWEIPAPTTWVFKLRPNVVFANGEPLDAAAVVAAITFLKQPSSQQLFAANETRGIATVRAIDPLTVEFTTTKPDAILDRRLSLIMIVPPKAWAELGADEFAQRPIGSGPFALDDWGQTSGRFSLNRNPTTWRPSRDVETIDIAPLVDSTPRAQALISNQVDFAYNLGLDALDDLERDGFKFLVRERSPVEALALPNTRKDFPTSDVRVRQAMNLAINRDAIAASILRGLTQGNAQGAVPEMFGFNPEIAPFPYDPDRAKRLLAEAGHPNGFKMTLAARLEGKGPEWAAIYQTVVQDLSKVGIDVTLRLVPAQEWLRMWATGDWRGADSTPFGWTSTYRDAGRSIETVSCLKPGAFFCVPEMVPEIEATAGDLDPASRQQRLRALLARLHDMAASLYLFAQIETMAFSPRVQNFRIDGSFARMEEITFAD